MGERKETTENREVSQINTHTWDKSHAQATKT